MSHHPVRLFTSSAGRAVALGLCPWLSSLVLAASPMPEQTRDADASAADAFRQAQERDELRRARLEVRPDVRLGTTSEAPNAPRLPTDESPCFPIQAVELVLASPAPLPLGPVHAALRGPAGDDAPQGKCLGARGAALLIERAQNSLIEQGFVTSRVLATPQDLSTGRLVLQIVPGRIAAVRLEGERQRPMLGTALPMGPGDLLNLRDVEQALENLRRVPSVQADIRIEPASQPGHSDLVIRWAQGAPWRLLLTADDSGDKSSGRYQGSATLSLDDPLALNDLLYVTLSHDLGGGEPGPRGTRGVNAHYSVPVGPWLLAFNASRSRYHQTVAGLTQDYVYSGQGDRRDVELRHMVHRDASSKTHWTYSLFARRSRNLIDDTEVEVQRRRVGGYQLGLEHQRQWGRATVEASVQFRRGTGAFGATAAPEDAFGEGTHRFALWQASAQWRQPWALGGLRGQYQGQWRWQHNLTPLTPQDRFAMGGRHTVRGFDGRASLAGDRGWLVRNELSVPIESGPALYVALDHGRVGGPSSQQLVGTRLTGLAVGARDTWQGVACDVFLGWPLAKPEAFRTARVSYGVAFSASY